MMSGFDEVDSLEYKALIVVPDNISNAYNHERFFLRTTDLQNLTPP